MATDVAFATGALAIAGKKAPSPLRTLVLALAVADDIGGLVVLALGYSGRIDLYRLGIAIGCCFGVAVLRRLGVESALPYAIVGLVCWEALVGSGIEPALAGVLVGLSTPALSASSGGLEQSVRPIVNIFVLPVFALANVGVDLRMNLFSGNGAIAVFVGILVARTAGKAVGVSTGSQVVKVAEGSPKFNIYQRTGAGAMCGVGFTVPLLFAERAFGAEPSLLAASRLGLVVGSLMAFLIGYVFLTWGYRDSTEVRTASETPRNSVRRRRRL